MSGEPFKKLVNKRESCQAKRASNILARRIKLTL